MHPRLVPGGAGATVFDNELDLFFATNDTADVVANAAASVALDNPDIGVNVLA
jgi:hypothetical protein